MTKRDKAIEAAARTYQELTEAEPFHDAPWLAAADALRAALALPPEPAAERSERERALVRMATARTAAFITNKADLVALHLNGNGMDDLLAELDRTHPARAEAPGFTLHRAADNFDGLLGSDPEPRAETPATVREWLHEVLNSFGDSATLEEVDLILANQPPPPALGPPPCAPPDEVLMRVAMDALRDPDAYSLIRTIDTAPPSAAGPAAERLPVLLRDVIARAKAGARHE